MHEERARANISKPPGGGDGYLLWLFVAGDEANSRQARKNLKQLSEGCIQGPCEIVIYDVLEDFRPALEHRVLVTPTLMRVWPLPRATILGNLSDTTKVLAALRRGGGKR